MTERIPHMRSQLVARWLQLVLAVVAACTFAIGPAWAQAGYSTEAKQAILIDADTNAILFEHNADQPMHPASMSKLMTLVMAFKAIRSGQLKLEDEIQMSVNAWRSGGAPSGTSAMFVPVGEKVTVNELLQGIIVQSGNDASIALAEALAGTEQAFAQLMTLHAREIGLKSSTFKNSTGLHDPQHLTTARDLAKLAQHVIKEYPEFYPMFAQPEFRYRRHRFINRNPLLKMDIGADGLKTGYTEESGYGIVASAKQDGRRLIVVVNGLPTAAKRRDEAARLLQWGFRSFSEFRLFDEGEIVGRARVWGGDQFYLPLTGDDGGVSVWLPRAVANQRLKAEIVYNSPLKPPIKKGEPVAKLRVTSAMNTTSEVPLYAAEDVAAAGIMRRGLDTLAYMAFRWIP
ncbi:MAG TPA: D-alanyl-D-alanine carboxypeptidase family protein [Hyphomicrobiaceae bacterium]|jgi:D-alanyl-D-alanine carboxypeptidase (penicillin-binding protein 5/6)